MHILLADDSKATAMPVIAYLTQTGHRVTYVQDGRAALDAFKAEMPDLVLLDIVMPEMDGIAVCRKIKELCGAHWLPVILMTALSAPSEIIEGLDAGADNYLTKPINPAILAAYQRSMQRIATMQTTLNGILDNAFEGIITIDGAGRVLSYNLAAERIFGYASREVIDSNVSMLMPARYAQVLDAYLTRHLTKPTPRVIGVGHKVQGRRKSGEVFPMHLAVSEVRQDGASLFVGLVRDISEEENARQRIEFLALHDPLTGLPNRANFYETLESTLMPSDTQQHALLFIDLDGFKMINDTLGHDAGDEALKTVATRLRHHLAGNDFAARLGGDEFVAIARNVADRAAAQLIGQRLIASISEPMNIFGTMASLGASIGIAMIPEHGSTPSAIVSAADHAMYAAKRSGKGRVNFASSSGEP